MPTQALAAVPAFATFCEEQFNSWKPTSSACTLGVYFGITGNEEGPETRLKQEFSAKKQAGVLKPFPGVEVR